MKPEQLETAPPLTVLLKDSFGGLKTVMEAMRFAGNDEVITAFLKKYDSIPSGDRETLPWEAIAISAGVNINHLLGSTMLAMKLFFAKKSWIIAATNHPEITKKRVEYGLLPSGEKDRNALDIMMGTIQSPKGPTFINKAIFGSSEGSKNDESENDEAPVAMTNDEQIESIFPSMSGIQEKLVKIRQRLLEK